MKTEEPLALTADWVVRLLNQLGYEKSATLVQWIAADARKLHQREEWWQDRYAELQARLNIYEPPMKPREGRSHRASPMSDG